MKILNTYKCHGGTVTVYQHESATLACDMVFSVFLPPQARNNKVPFVTFLSGLTCNHENFTTKAGAYEVAAQLGIAIIAPDTSPRGDHVPDDAHCYDFGKGAGFYINATQEPWSKNYQMESYIAEELNALVLKELPLLKGHQGIMGHSMGGHGALTLYLKYPKQYKSCSAFSPIVAPSQVPWGEKAFSGYLGDDKAEWLKHDATALVSAGDDRSAYSPILIDQGTDDQFLEKQLKPDLFKQACGEVGQTLQCRMQDGYDHSYYFIQSFIKDHLHHHAQMIKSS